MPALARNPSSLTKERLAEELRKNKVPLPSGRARKEVYVELYRRHLLGEQSVSQEVVSLRNMSVNTSPKFSFSSDEEDEVVVAKVKKHAALNANNNRSQRKAARKAKSSEFEDRLAEVEGLSDADLRKELQARGVAAGPIVATTRAVYERKLADILLQTKPQQEEEAEEEEEAVDEADVAEEGSTEEDGDSQENGHYSDSDVDEKADAAPMTRSSYKSRVTQIIDQESFAKARQRNVTPKPKTTSTTTTTSSSSTTVTKTTVEKGRGKPRVPVWLQILIFLLVAAFLLLIWYNMESGQPQSPLVSSES